MTTDHHVRPVRIGCLGVAGAHTAARVRALRGLANAELCVAADDDTAQQQYIRDLGLTASTPPEMLADPTIHAILVSSPTDRMADYGCRALQAGKPVFVEKPGGQSLADLRKLRDAAAETGVLCQVGYSFRFSPVTRRLDAALAGGELGRVLQVRIHGCVSNGRAARPPMNWPGDMGGAVFVIGSHMLDLLVHHFGLPQTVNARIPKFGTLMGTGSREDAGVAILLYRDMIASFDFSAWDPAPWMESWEISVYGTEGIVHATPLPRSVRQYRAPRDSVPSGWTTWRESSFPLTWTNEREGRKTPNSDIHNLDFYEAELAAFVEAVRTGGPSPLPASEAHDVCVLLDAMFCSSSRNGEEVRLT